MKLTKQEALVKRRKLIRLAADHIELGMPRARTFDQEYKRKMKQTQQSNIQR